MTVIRYLEIALHALAEQRERRLAEEQQEVLRRIANEEIPARLELMAHSAAASSSGVVRQRPASKTFANCDICSPSTSDLFRSPRQHHNPPNLRFWHVWTKRFADARAQGFWSILGSLGGLKQCPLLALDELRQILT